MQKIPNGLVQWRRRCVGMVALLVALAFASCARHYRLAIPADIKQLPMRYGWDGTTVAAVTPWQYRGSRYQTHEFRYYYNRANPLQHREVSVARDRTVLNFEERAFGDSRQWVTLQTDGQIFYFSLLPLHR